MRLFFHVYLAGFSITALLASWNGVRDRAHYDLKNQGGTRFWIAMCAFIIVLAVPIVFAGLAGKTGWDLLLLTAGLVAVLLVVVCAIAFYGDDAVTQNRPTAPPPWTSFLMGAVGLVYSVIALVEDGYVDRVESLIKDLA